MAIAVATYLTRHSSKLYPGEIRTRDLTIFGNYRIGSSTRHFDCIYLMCARQLMRNSLNAFGSNFFSRSRFRQMGEAATTFDPRETTRTTPFWKLSGANVIIKFYSWVTTLCWNKALWLDVLSHVTSFTQSECFNSV